MQQENIKKEEEGGKKRERHSGCRIMVGEKQGKVVEHGR